MRLPYADYRGKCFPRAHAGDDVTAADFHMPIVINSTEFTTILG